MKPLHHHRNRTMTQEEALDVETRVTSSEAIAELKAHCHNATIRTFPNGEMIGTDAIYTSWIVVEEGKEVEKIAEIDKGGTVSTFEIMAWMGY